MARGTATSILKLCATLVVFLGLILFSGVLCQIHTVNGATYKPPIHSYYFPVAIMCWGIVLYLSGSRLGSMIASD